MEPVLYKSTTTILRVLVVEDVKPLRILVCELVKRSIIGGLIIDIAENGKQAIEVYNQFKPNIIITDVFMPIMSGFELIQTLNEQNSSAKIIVMSDGNYFPALPQTLLHLNMDDKRCLPIVINKDKLIYSLPAALATILDISVYKETKKPYPQLVS